MKRIVYLFVLILLLCVGCEVETVEEPVVKTYTVSFVTNTDSVMSDLTVEEGKSARAPEEPVNEGYVFGGWYSDSSLTKKFNFPAKVSADITLYAKWILIKPCTVKWAGIRVSSYGMRSSFGRNFPDVDTMAGFAEKMESCYEGSTGAYLLIVGTMSGDDSCSLNFPVSEDYDYIYGSRNDRYEEYLDKFDELGYSVWLQVEPGYADLVTLATLVLDQYGHHSCVKGFGIDVEWHKPVEGVEEGTKLSAQDARKVVAKVREYNPEYTVFVKHWEAAWLPANVEGLIYVDDWQQFTSLRNAVSVFAEWSKTFAPYPVMFQIGYDADTRIWSAFENPAKEFGQTIVDGCNTGNDVGIIWVDFTLDDVIDKIVLEGEEPSAD